MKLTNPAAVSAAVGALLLSACAGPDSGGGSADPLESQTPGTTEQDDSPAGEQNGSPAGASLGTITIDGESITLINGEWYDAENDTDLVGYCTIGPEDTLPAMSALVGTADGRAVAVEIYDENNWYARLLTDHSSHQDVWILSTQVMRDNPIASGTAELSGQRVIVEGVWLASAESTETADVRLEVDCSAAS